MPCIIGFCGPIGAGKDTAAAITQNLVQDVYGYNFRVGTIRLADPIKRAIESMYGLSAGTLESRELKQKEAPGTGGKTYRQLMQMLGTEWGRNMINKDLWINITKYRAITSYYDLVLIPDIRFYDEYEALIQQTGGYLIEIVPARHDASGDEHKHVSEQGLQRLSEVAVANIVNKRDSFEELEALLSPIIKKICEALKERCLEAFI